MHGVTPDDVAAVILVADPGRARRGALPARPVKLYGLVPAGIRAANGEIILDGGTGVSAGRKGMTGQRPGNFAGMEGKVVSLCNNTDMACATPSDTIVHDIADYANRVEWEGPSETLTARVVERFLAGMSEGKDVGAALDESGASVLQVPALVATVAGCPSTT